MGQELAPRWPQESQLTTGWRPPGQQEGPFPSSPLCSHFMGFCWGLSSGTPPQSSAGLQMTHETKDPQTDVSPSQCSGSLLQKKKGWEKRVWRWQEGPTG